MFVLRREYSESDGEVLDAMVYDYLRKYTTAYGEEFCKPKHHSLKHLRKYLKLYGPFRDNWCFPFELFLIKLKRYAKIGNWKHVPYTVAKKWAHWRAYLRWQGTLASAATCHIDACSDVITGMELCSARSTSNILALQLACTAARYIRSVSVERADVACGEWVLLLHERTAVIAFIQEMMEITVNGKTSIHLFCTRCSANGAVEESDGAIIVRKSKKSRTVCANLDHVAVQLVHCIEHASYLECRYLL